MPDLSWAMRLSDSAAVHAQHARVLLASNDRLAAASEFEKAHLLLMAAGLAAQRPALGPRLMREYGVE